MASGARYFNRGLADRNGTEFSKPRPRYPKRNLRSADFWNDSDDDTLKPSRSRKSWADLCEESENDLHSPIRKSPANTRKPRRLDSSSVESSPAQENGSRVNGKKGRKLEDMFKLVDHSDSGSSIKSPFDSVSTSASTSDNESENDKIKRYERDPLILSRRQKQIDYGKNTNAYKAYLKAIPKRDRVPSKHVYTPKKHLVYSRRSWDSQIKIWRKRLHEYDTKSNNDDDDDDEAEIDLSGMIAMMSPK